jgi:hypothetical protein
MIKMVLKVSAKLKINETFQENQREFIPDNDKDTVLHKIEGKILLKLQKNQETLNEACRCNAYANVAVEYFIVISTFSIILPSSVTPPRNLFFHVTCSTT